MLLRRDTGLGRGESGAGVLDELFRYRAKRVMELHPSFLPLATCGLPGIEKQQCNRKAEKEKWIELKQVEGGKKCKKSFESEDQGGNFSHLDYFFFLFFSLLFEEETPFHGGFA